MSEGLTYGDLIVLGAVAAFIILRYRSILGQKTGRDPSTLRPPVMREREAEKVVSIQPSRAAAPAEAPPEALPPALTAGVAAIKAHDPDFSLSAFLGGARAAFEMVLEAVNQQDDATLKMLLAADVYESFSQDADQLKAKGQRRHTTLVALKSAEATDVRLKRQMATVTVQFVSEQIQVIKDAGGAVVEGDASDIQDVADEWTFERDVKSRNPNWTVIAT